MAYKKPKKKKSKKAKAGVKGRGKPVRARTAAGRKAGAVKKAQQSRGR